MKRILLGALAFAAVGCGSKSSDPLVNVGAFGIPVPENWHNVTDSRIEKGSVAIATLKVGDRKNKPNVTIIAHPLPEPLVADPTVADNCTKHVASLPASIDVELHQVVTLPGGKACSVQASAAKLRVSQIVLAAKGHAVMANCTYELPEDEKLCDQVFARIKLR